MNRPPVPGSVATITGQQVPVSTSVAQLLSVATDPDGDAMSVPSVNPLSAAGGTVTLSNALGTYAPAPGFVGSDAWTYLLTDTQGAASNGTVTVTVVSSNAITLNPVGAALSGDGSFTASFVGVPGLIYTVDRTIDLTGPWELGFTNLMAGTNGVFLIDDPNQPVAAQRFYRARYP